MALSGCTAQSNPTGTPDAAALEAKIDALQQELARVEAYGEIQNVFSRYQYLHTAFRDDEIINSLWVKKGTPGISAQYTNSGVYNTWDSVMEYHRNRPSPTGKLLTHLITTPLIEVAADGKTAKAVFIVTGVESGLSDPEAAEKAPPAMFEPGDVNGKKVWAHNIQARYHIDFLNQDGEWRIWHFRCVELSRSPFSQNWIAFAAMLEANASTAQFHNDLAFFGDDGVPTFMPEVDGPPKNIAYGYRTDHAMSLEPPLPEPYATAEETFDY